MRLIFSSFIFCLILQNTKAQSSAEQAGWQQSSDHVIDAEIDSSLRHIKAKMKWIYHNNSPHTLNEIYIHLWPNAYRDNRTAYAKQLKRINRSEFLVSSEASKGNIKADFKVGGTKLILKTDTLNPDLAVLKLNAPLQSGKSIEIDVDFSVRLPDLFSRSGVIGNFAAVCQWYPKPAVYDANGWNPMPYLEQGEFYSEFGTFDVSVVVPDKFTVAATGNQVGFSYGNGKKIYRFKESNIHDFAWFVSSSFDVANYRFPNNGDTVEISVYSDTVKSWKKSEDIISYVQKTIELYSSEIGKYPYKTCKIVLGPLKAGAGMEYPTIALCASDAPEVIAHEVGHNWFYGVLASNERNHPWMDESVNSYFDHKVRKQVVYFNPRSVGTDPDFYHQSLLGMTQSTPPYLNLKLIQGNGDLQSLDLGSEDYFTFNYSNVLYGKGPMSFEYLRQVIGEEKMIQCFRNYYSEWQFKHPLPDDMKRSFEKTCQADLSWFFDEVLGDVGSLDVKYKNGKWRVSGSRFLDSFWTARQENPNKYGSLYEFNYRNNGQRKDFIKLNFILGYQRLDKRINTNLVPMMGYNYYDKLYPGLCLNNIIYNPSGFQYVIAPVYSVYRKHFGGYIRLSESFLIKKGTVKKASVGIESQSFGIEADGFVNQYYKVNPYLKLEFRRAKKGNDKSERFIQLDFYKTGLQNDKNSFRDSLGNTYSIDVSRSYFMNYLRFSFVSDNHADYTGFRYSVNGEHGFNLDGSKSISRQYSKVWIEGMFRQMYAKKKYFRSAFFAGTFLSVSGSNESQIFYISKNAGFQDYLYNDFNFGRSENDFSNNFLKSYFNGPGLRTNLYSFGSSKWMMTLKNDIDLPGILPFRVYFDLGTYAYTKLINGGAIREEVKPQLYYVGGIEFKMLKSAIEIFVPLFQSTQFIKPASARLPGLGFRINLNRFKPEKIFNEMNLNGK